LETAIESVIRTEYQWKKNDTEVENILKTMINYINLNLKYLSFNIATLIIINSISIYVMIFQNQNHLNFSPKKSSIYKA